MQWNIYIDRSSSMSHHSNYSVSTLSSGIDEIIDKVKKLIEDQMVDVVEPQTYFSKMALKRLMN